ncbi:MAG: hypothetical protein H8E55_11295 [Pelagibacterales bacterium]|nr:hypothetical protein [Pelagibacterales bacterium]
MTKICKIILWIICGVLLSHASACVGITTGALDGAIGKQERINRVEAAATAVGLDQGEFNNLERKMNRVVSCINTVENDPKYYPLKIKNPDNPTYKHFQDSSYITSDERKILAWYIGAAEICYDIFRYDTYRSPLVAEFQLIMDRAFLEALAWHAKLDNGEVTWGQFNREGELFQTKLEDRVERWKYKVQSKTAQVVSIVAMQEEQIYLRRQRESYKKEFQRNRTALQKMRNDNRRLQNQKRHLERCSRYPGAYMNCPN